MKNRFINSLFHITDWFPTLLWYGKAEIPANIDGVNQQVHLRNFSWEVKRPRRSKFVYGATNALETDWKCYKSSWPKRGSATKCFLRFQCQFGRHTRTQIHVLETLPWFGAFCLRELESATVHPTERVGALIWIWLYVWPREIQVFSP